MFRSLYFFISFYRILILNDKGVVCCAIVVMMERNCNRLTEMRINEIVRVKYVEKSNGRIEKGGILCLENFEYHPFM